MGFTPSSGEEIQSEYLLPRRHAVEAFAAVRRLGSRIQPLLFVTEIRTVAADRLWMSMNYGEDCVALHFTWQRDQDAVERITAEIEETLAPFQMRPHWGKLFHMNAATVATLYERHGDFVRLQERLDPRGAFRNQWLQAHVLDTA
jgi:xylitol oxidase